jgi:glycosyltransferase involved in cell wall biosynthesis
MNVPVLIPTFNNPTYLRNMLAQLRSLRLRDIRVVDNASTFPPMLELLATIEREFRVVRLHENAGPRALLSAENRAALPQFFCITDPDLQFNPDLPANFPARLIELTERHRIGKAGFALDISEPEKLRPNLLWIRKRRWRIWEWEAQFWDRPLGEVEGNPYYAAAIDTTFALCNQAYLDASAQAGLFRAVRVAGRYTAKHLPWYRDHHLPPEEAEFYRTRARRSVYVGLTFRERTSLASGEQIPDRSSDASIR